MTLQRDLILSKNQVETLKKHAKQKEPNESCALLFGRSKDGKYSVTDIFLTESASPSPVNFTISNDDLIKAYCESERKKLEVIAIFHSHPDSPAYPSTTDCQYMEINPIPWIIYSNVKNELQAYILESALVPINVRVL